jgi:hypothetical protein
MADPKLTKFSRPAAHSLVTDDEYMIGLGLGTTTTGILYSYFCARDKNGLGNYVNRGIVRDGDNNPITNINQLFGSTSNQPKWQGFRNQGRNVGKYEDMTWDDWDIDEVIDDGGNTRRYTLDSNWYSYWKVEDGFILSQDGDFNPAGDGQLDSYDIPVDVYDKVKPYPPLLQQDQSFMESVGDSPVTSMIIMNEFLIDARNAVPNNYPAFSGLNEANPPVSFGKETLPAVDEFINDIQAAKNGGVEFSGELTFNTVLAGGSFTCAQKRWVKWTLYLEDKVPDPVKAQPIVVPSRNMVAEFAKDELGRNTYSLVDGEVETSDETKPTEKVAADFKLNYNSYLNKYESGTSRLMGVVVSGDLSTNIGISAAVIPNITDFEEDDVDEMINGDNITKKVIPGTGIVMPIFMQNNNPKQWGPKYAEDKGCREPGDNKKQTVTGYNFNPKKQYSRGDQVYISQVGGIWHITDPGTGVVDDVVRPKSLGENWTFQQFATNSEFWFSDKNERFRFDPSIYERKLHLFYYNNDSKNGGLDEEKNPTGRQYNEQFSTVGLSYAGINMENGYWQISSFDWMDSQIFGTRGQLGNHEDKMAINQTQAFLDPIGQTIPRDANAPVSRNGCHSNAFFGCVFPDGYVVPTTYDAPRDYQIQTYVSGERPLEQIEGDNLKVTDGLKSFFNTDEDNSEFLPFFDERPEGADPFTGYARTDPMLPYFSRNGIDDPMPQQDGWDRISFRASHSMFATYSAGTDKTLKQLPADVACLGSPEEKYGGPLYSIYRMARWYNFTQINKTDLMEGIKSAFEQCAWLGKEGEPESSAFAFKPKDPARIQFRPMKRELYAAYHPLVFDQEQFDPADFWNSDRLYDAGDGLVSIMKVNEGEFQESTFDGKRPLVPERGLYGEPLDPPAGGWQFISGRTQVYYANEMRGSWSCGPARQMKSQTNIHDQFLIKSRNTNLNRGTLPPIYIEDWVHSHNVIYNQIGPNESVQPETATTEAGLRHLYSDFRGPYQPSNPNSLQGVDKWISNGDILHDLDYYQSTFPQPNVDYGFWWRDPWNWKDREVDSFQDGLPENGSNGYGVIAAHCTCTVNDELEFNVVTDIGMGSKRVGANYFKVWDVGANNYRGTSTTNLCVTVYQWHPRKQTIYDGPNFCVHHFNPEPEYQGYYAIDDTPSSHRSQYEEDPSADEQWPFNEDVEIQVLNVPQTLTRDIDITGGDDIDAVGIREPSYPFRDEGQGEEKFRPKLLVEGDVVFRNQVDPGFAEEGLRPLSTNNSHLNLTRVGKLLPYRYKYYYYAWPLNELSETGDIGDQTFDVPGGAGLSGFEIITVQQFLDGEATGQPAINAQNKLVVISQGAGYSEGDVIGNTTYGIRYEVASVSEGTEDEPKGAVKAIRALAYGEGTYNSAIDTDEVLQGFEGDGIGIATLESSTGGTGFRAFYVNNVVSYRYAIDQKPLYAQREKLISATPGLPPQSSSNYGFITDSTDTSLPIDDSWRSPYAKYDLFFYFHNDINMTHMSNASNYYYALDQTPPVDEQYIELQITGE